MIVYFVEGKICIDVVSIFFKMIQIKMHSDTKMYCFENIYGFTSESVDAIVFFFTLNDCERIVKIRFNFHKSINKNLLKK